VLNLSKMASIPNTVDRVNAEMWGVIYRLTLVGVASDHPLHNIVYIGQAIRAKAKSADEVANSRWKEEINDAAKYEKKAGLLWALDEFGEDAFRFEIIESRKGLRTDLRKWTDQREVELIDNHGGVLKDQTKRLNQTLNIQRGGHGIYSPAFAVISAVLWDKFLKEMHIFIESHPMKGCRVPQNYMTPEGYSLGYRLNAVKMGILVSGYPDRLKQLQQLPLWGDGNWRSDSIGHQHRSLVSKERMEQAKIKHGDDIHSRRREKAVQTERDRYGDDFRKRKNKEVWDNQTEDQKIQRLETLAECRPSREFLSQSAKNQKSNDPEGWQRFKEANDAQLKRRSELVLQTALQQPPFPFEPNAQNRVPGKFYWRNDGLLARCTSQRGLKPIKNQPSLN